MELRAERGFVQTRASRSARVEVDGLHLRQEEPARASRELFTSLQYSYVNGSLYIDIFALLVCICT